MNRRATLYIFCGLPGSGKTTLSKLLARHLGAAYLRIDTVEQGLRDLCNLKVEGEGYRLCYSLAGENLAIGVDVIADSCNPIELTRREWEAVAQRAQANFLNIEVVCSDEEEHRLRVESRESTVPGLRMPTWEQVQAREYHAWTERVLRIDTAGKSPEQCLQELLSPSATGKRE